MSKQMPEVGYDTSPQRRLHDSSDSLGAAMVLMADAVVRQVVFALTFQSDGRGLPGKATPAFWFLVTLTGVLSVEHQIGDVGTLIWLVAPAIVVGVLSALGALQAKHFRCLSLFLCCAIGVNALTAVQQFFDVEPRELANTWGVATFVVCALRVLSARRRSS